MEKRRIIELLPAVNQTDTLKKFFDGTVDHLFQPNDSAIVSGYIGRFPPYTKISDEFYVDEPTTNRQSYQLEPIMISRSEETSEIQTSLFYDNLVDDIRFNGGIVDNHDRLFRSEYYSWCPPIDIDMLMNWSSYYWMADGPSVICVESETNIGELIGTSDQITIAVTYSFNNITESGHLKLSNGQKIRLENDTNSTFNDKTFIVTGIGSYFNLIDDTIRRQIPWDNTTNYDSCSTSSDPLIIYLDGITIDDAISDIDGNQEYRFEQGWWKNITDGNLIPSDVNSGGCVMTISDDYPCGATEIASYAPIILTNGGRYVLMEKTSDGWKSKSILIDGVGESINVITDEYGWDSDEWDRGPIGTVGTTSYGNPDYIVMERGAVDANPWSVGNRWFHRDVLHEQDFSTAIQAKRPILCFDVNLSLYNFGQNSLGYIDIKEDSLTFSQINQFDATDPEIYLDALGYPIIWYVGDGSTINFNLPETFEETSVEVFVDGNKLSSGDFTVDAINQIVVLNVAPADGVSVGVFGGIRGYDHLRDYGIAPLLLDADETTKRWIDKNDPSWSLVLGGPVNVWNSIVTAIDEEQLIKSAIFIDDMIQIKGIHYSIQGNSILFNYNIPAGSEIKVIYWDSSKGILAQDGMIVMITDDTLESVENRVFMINGIKATGKISLAPLDPLLNSPEIGDSWFVRYGIENGNSHVYFDGENWIYGQQKTSLNQEPLFNLYDIDGVSINDTGRYPRSTFRGSRIFGFADPVGNVVDEIYGRPIRYDSQNHVVWKNHINTLLADNVYHYSRDLLPISGFYFHRKNINGEFVYSNDWYVSDVQTRQRIRQIYIPFGGETKITIPFNFTIREKKEDVRFAITTNVALNGTTLLIDSVTPEDGDRLILVGQTDKKENGIYEYNQNIGSYTLFRPADADGDSDGPVNEGMFVNVSEGLYRKTAWVLITKNPIIGQTELKFDQIDGPYPFEQSIEVDKNNFILQLGIDYEVIDGDVVFLNPLVKNDIVRISTFDNSSRDNDVGSYVVPLNLQANPNWEQVDLIAQTEFYDHFSSIMTNQIDFSGSVVGLNNYRDTHKNRSYGTSILQHRSPLLKTMLLSSQSDFDLLDSMRYVEREYDRFKKKFRNKLVDLYVNVYDKVVNVDTFVNDAIDAINLGKTTDFPFAYSDVMVSGNLIRQYQFDIIAGQDEYVIPDFSENDLNRSLIYRNGELLLRNYHYVIENGELVFIESLSGQIDVHLYNRYGSYVPPTPAVLGITGLYKPEIITDTTLMTPRQFIIGHDGSYNELFNDEYADLNEIILEFEKRCYNLALSKLSDRDSRLVIENTPLVAGKFRRSSDYDNIDSSKRSSYRSSYDLDEFNKIARSSFERWAIASRIEWRKNTTYDPQNRFTWNYHGTVDKDGDSLPGHWRGIMRYYYDTDRPHICPWEMLGLSQKPNWWDNRYGSYPYTRGNTLLWTDLENGFVAEGENSGHYAEYARPGLSNVIPVDEYGNLLDPVAIGIIVQTPSVSMLSANWKFGDCGPGETMWRRSSYYPYALASATYLMNPSSFVERTWDVGRSLKIFKDTISEQWVYDDSRQRVPHDRLQIHGEIINNQIYHANGCQQFISDFIKSKNQSIERFGNFIRGINVQLGHKMAGYINSSTLQMRADNIGFLPQEDVDVYLYRSPSIAEYTYSGVIIEWTGRSWKVVGYDPLNPFFRIIQSDPNGHRSTVTVGNANLADTAPRWRSQVQYTVGVVVMYVSPTITESPSWQAGTLYKQDQRVTYEGITYRAISTHTSGGIFDISKWSSINIESTGLYRCTRAHLSKSFSDDIGNWEPISDTSKNDGISVIYYRDGKKNSPIIEIPYGTEFFKQQDLFDFLISYQRYLTSVGWKFDLFDSGNNETVDFLSVGKDFLLWSLARWTPGTFLALSPLSQKASFETEHGEIQNIEQITNGIYSILDREGLPISLNSTLITRYGGSVDIKPKSSDLIYFVKLFVSEVEHALTVSNRTIFGDIIYRPLFNLRQPRLKLYATKSNNWNGRVDAPGYVITDNIVTPLFDGTLVDNFEKSINDFRRYYSIEDVVENPTILEHARHLIGYQPRSYLIDLLLTPTSQFQFYQGMIKKKGTISAFSSLLRSYYITDAEDVLIQDEWAFRVGRYGNDEQDYFEFFINDGDVKGQPVLVDFSAIVRNNDVINDLSNDTTLNIPFPYRWKENTFYERGEVVSYEDQYYAAKNDTLTATEFDDQNWIIVSRDDRWRYKPLKSNGKIFPSVRIEYDAETWVPNTTYNVGSYVIYNEKVWQLIGNGNSSIFDDTQWKLIKTNIGYPKTGYARSDEIDFYAWNLDDLENIRIERLEDDLSFSDGQTVMLYADKYDDWSTHKMTLPSMIPNNSTVVSDTSIRTYPIPGGRPKLIDTVIVTHNNAQIDSFEVIDDNIVIDDNFVLVVGDIIDISVSTIIQSYADDDNDTIIELSRPQNLTEGQFVIIQDHSLDFLNRTYRIKEVKGTVSDPVKYVVDFSYNTVESETPVVYPINYFYGPQEDTVIRIIIDVIEPFDGNYDGPSMVIGDETDPDKFTSSVNLNVSGQTIIIPNGNDGLYDSSDLMQITFTPAKSQLDEFSITHVGNGSRFVFSLPSGYSWASAQPGFTLLVTIDGQTQTENIDYTIDVINEMIHFNSIPLDESEIIIVVNPQQIAPTSGRVVITTEVVRQCAFSVDLNFTDPTDDLQTNGVGGELLLLYQTRFNNRNQRDAIVPSNGWSVGDIVFVDSGTEKTKIFDNGSAIDVERAKYGWWSVYAYDTEMHSVLEPDGTTSVSNWKLIRSETPKIDNEKLNFVNIYDTENGQIEHSFTVHDPSGGVIPGIVERDLWYIIDSDPAKYTNGDDLIDMDSAWGPEEIGRLWWDISAVRFYDYEIDDNSYRRFRWGNVAPRTSIDVYEWVRSPVPPASWNRYVESNGQSTQSQSYFPSGSVKDEENPRWVERIEYDVIEDINKTFYYFWVKNPESIPSVPFRNVSASSISAILTNPANQGLTWAAAISEDSMLLHLSEYGISGENLACQFKITDDNEMPLHNQWLLVKENDTAISPDDNLWRKMKDSLVGFDGLSNTIPDSTLSAIEMIGNFTRPRQTWFLPTLIDGEIIASRMAREIFVKKLNEIASNRPLAEETNWSEYLYSTDEDTLSITTEDATVNVIVIDLAKQDETLEDYELDSVICATTENIDLLGGTFGGTIDGLPLEDGYRVLVKNQTIPYENGIYVYDDISNTFSRASDANVGSTQFGYASNVKVELGHINRGTIWVQIAKPGNVGLSPIEFRRYLDIHLYHYDVDNFDQRDSLLTDVDITMEPGQAVLVRGNVDTNGFWSIWHYTGISTSPWTENPQLIQKYKTEDFWQIIDWYADGYDSLFVPRYTFADELERNLFGNFVDGDVIEIRNIGIWQIYNIIDGVGRWTTIHVKNGTFEFLSKLYTNTKLILPTTNDYDFGDVSDRDGSIELTYIIDAMRNIFTPFEQNEIFFAMIHFVHSEQNSVDWAFKTSYVSVRNINEPLEQTPVLVPSKIDAFIDFVNEIKPYHVKLREFVIRYYLRDEGNFLIEDFDKPVYPVETGPSVVIPSEYDGSVQISQSDRDDMENSRYHRGWIGQIDDWDDDDNPIRKTTIKMFFDRTKWIDWVVDLNSFVSLYNDYHDISVRWERNRSHYLGQRVFVKRATDYRVYLLTTSNEISTNISEITNIGTELVVETNIPHSLLEPFGSNEYREKYGSGMRDQGGNIVYYDPTFEPIYVVFTNQIPNFVFPNNGPNGSIGSGGRKQFDLGYSIDPNDIRVFVNGVEQIGKHETTIIDGPSYRPENNRRLSTLDQYNYKVDGQKIIFKSPIGQNDSLYVFIPSTFDERLRGTHLVKSIVSDTEFTIDGSIDTTILNSLNIPIEIYMYRAETITNVADQVNLNVDPSEIEPITKFIGSHGDDGLSAAERIALYYNGGNGLPEKNIRELTESELNIPRVDGSTFVDSNGDSIEGCNPGSISYIREDDEVFTNSYYPLPFFHNDHHDPELVGWDCHLWDTNRVPTSNDIRVTVDDIVLDPSDYSVIKNPFNRVDRFVGRDAKVVVVLEPTVNSSGNCEIAIGDQIICQISHGNNHADTMAEIVYAINQSNTYPKYVATYVPSTNKIQIFSEESVGERISHLDVNITANGITFTGDTTKPKAAFVLSQSPNQDRTPVIDVYYRGTYRQTWTEQANQSDFYQIDYDSSSYDAFIVVSKDNSVPSDDDEFAVQYDGSEVYMLDTHISIDNGSEIIIELITPLIHAAEETNDNQNQQYYDIKLHSGSFTTSYDDIEDIIVDGGFKNETIRQMFVVTPSSLNNFALAYKPIMPVIDGTYDSDENPSEDISDRFKLAIDVFVNGIERFDYHVWFDISINAYRLTFYANNPPQLYDEIVVSYKGVSNINNPFIGEDRPQELVPVQSSESINMEIYESINSGSPVVFTTNYVADGVKDTFNIGQPINLSNMVFVYVNGLLTNVSVNVENQTITLLTIPAKDSLITIVSFSMGGTDGITEEKYTSDGIQTAYSIGHVPLDPSTVRVVVMGSNPTILPAADYMVVGSNVLLNAPITNGVDLLVQDNPSVGEIKTFNATNEDTFELDNPRNFDYSTSTVIATVDGIEVPIMGVSTNQVVLSVPVTGYVTIVAFNTNIFAKIDTNEYAYNGFGTIALSTTPSSVDSVIIYRQLIADDIGTGFYGYVVDANDVGRYVRLIPNLDYTLSGSDISLTGRVGNGIVPRFHSGQRSDLVGQIFKISTLDQNDTIRCQGMVVVDETSYQTDRQKIFEIDGIAETYHSVWMTLNGENLVYGRDFVVETDTTSSARILKSFHQGWRDEDIISVAGQSSQVDSWFKFTHDISGGNLADIPNRWKISSSILLYDGISGTYVGTVSMDKYSSYAVKGRLSSANSNGLISIVAAYYRDSSNNVHTLDIVRSTGTTSWAIYYNYNKVDEQLLVDGSTLIGSTGDWTNASYIEVYRRNDIIYALCSEFGQTEISISSKIEIDLNSNPILGIFDRPCSFGYACEGISARFAELKFSGYAHYDAYVSAFVDQSYSVPTAYRVFVDDFGVERVGRISNANITILTDDVLVGEDYIQVDDARRLCLGDKLIPSIRSLPMREISANSLSFIIYIDGIPSAVNVNGTAGIIKASDIAKTINSTLMLSNNIKATVDENEILLIESLDGQHIEIVDSGDEIVVEFFGFPEINAICRLDQTHAVFINGDKIEFDAVDISEYPHKLLRFNRGSLFTATGIGQRRILTPFVANGTDSTFILPPSIVAISEKHISVKINNNDINPSEYIIDTNGQIQITFDTIPNSGDIIVIAVTTNDWTNSSILYQSGDLVIDCGPQQFIPGGYDQNSEMFKQFLKERPGFKV